MEINGSIFAKLYKQFLLQSKAGYHNSYHVSLFLSKDVFKKRINVFIRKLSKEKYSLECPTLRTDFCHFLRV